MFIKNKLALLESVEAMLSQEQRMNQIANNLANVDTSGYKRESNTFWEVLITQGDKPQRVGKGVQVVTDASQGRLEPTGNPLDLALAGEGYFRIQTPNGIRYTRDGNFQLNQQGQLSTASGALVMGEGGSIVVSGSNVTIAEDGRVRVDGVLVDRIGVARFADLDMLKKEGMNLYRMSDEGAVEVAADNVTIQQGYLEGSNVNTVSEMTDMMALYRDYESQQRAIRIADDLDDQAVRKVGRLMA
ncbi:MAG: flagellar basal-body rod protein FlgF [Proteobacteria bacterium]|nr:flagellar basal-body rod protein FlgF [Pseudomonadota bacterium]MBU1687478.1 flagellar basal-body rod protein FlgF [Pseudomonadota bacterium]